MTIDRTYPIFTVRWLAVPVLPVVSAIYPLPSTFHQVVVLET